MDGSHEPAYIGDDRCIVVKCPFLADYSATASRCRMPASNGLHPAEADPKRPASFLQSGHSLQMG